MTFETEKIFAHIDACQVRLMELLDAILGIDNSIPPGQNYDKLVDYIEPLFREAGLATERVVVPKEKIDAIPLPLEGERVNLLASAENGKAPVTIYAHMDTVPVEETWKHDPFRATLENGVVYGRGIVDMKGSIACLLLALETIRDLDLELKYDPICAMCTDEEVGGYPGILHLAREGHVKGHILCMEGFQEATLAFWLGSAGMIDATIRVHGKSCHSGMNYLGVNAIEESVPILNELMALKTKVQARESEIRAFAVPGAPSKMMTPMFNIDVMHAGNKSNTVPSEAVIIVNRRYISEETAEKAQKEISDAIARGREKSKALDVTVEFAHFYDAGRYNPDTPYVNRMKEAFKLVHGYKDEDFVYGGLAGSTDMASVSNELNMHDVVFCGVGRPDSAFHGADEHTAITDLLALSKELAYYLCA
ncbi:M20 family metallopeptidase [Candidatus Hydrogenedentota bacterium]